MHKLITRYYINWVFSLFHIMVALNNKEIISISTITIKTNNNQQSDEKMESQDQSGQDDKDGNNTQSTKKYVII